MDPLTYFSDVGDKLIVILRKLGQPSLKIADEVVLEKLLTGLKNELAFNAKKVGNLRELIDWFCNTAECWVDNPPPTSLFTFVVQLIGILCGNEEIFKAIQDSKLLDIHLNGLKIHIRKNTHAKLSYITLLSNVVSHESGAEWVTTTRLWREVVDIYVSQPGLFVEREATLFFTKYLENINWDSSTFEEMLKMLLAPLEYYRREFERGQMNEKNFKFFQKKLENIAIPIFHAFSVLLETWIVSRNLKDNVKLLQSVENYAFWKFLLETCDRTILLEKVSSAYILQSMCLSSEVAGLKETQEIPDFVVEIFKIFIREKKISNIIKLAKYCQLLWNKISLSTSSIQNAELDINFIVIQLIPALLLLKKPKQELCFLELYANKIFDLTSENTQRLGYSLRDMIRDPENGDSMDYSYQAVLSVSENIETLNLKRAVIVFQGLAYILKIFIPRSCELDDPITDEQFRTEQMLCLTKSGLLSAILNAICILIEKFKIDWTESLESLCLLRFSSVLLNNPNLPPRIGVQTLLLIKLAILNFMEPNLALLIDNIEGTSFESLLPILYKRLHDPSWEIRDSCIEVIGIIAELAESKYPVFQDILIDGNYCKLIVSMMENDSESYVRSSALRVLSHMIRIDNLRNKYFNNVDLVSKTIAILKMETEGIVRREAALLAKELFASQACRPDQLPCLFGVMGYTAIHDLHWEVKVNSLFFWEKVIQTFTSDQGMIDGFFPSITFSKDNKKIVSLTKDEIRLRLNKVLNELSSTGCLFVLVTTLKDDYDFQVVAKSAQILTDLLDLLKRYDLFKEESTSVEQGEKQSVKRKSNDEGLPEKKLSHKDIIDEVENDEVKKSNKVIEDIVNEQDLQLLSNVYNPLGSTKVQETEKFSLKKINPDSFLREMQNFNIISFLNAKQKWLFSREDDVNELLNDILTLSVECETNNLDCY